MGLFQVHVQYTSKPYFAAVAGSLMALKVLVVRVSCVLLQGMACVGRTKQCTIVPSNHFGPIPGVPVGSMWKFRVQVRVCWLPFWEDGEDEGRVFPACKMHMDVSVCNSKFATQVALAWT